MRKDVHAKLQAGFWGAAVFLASLSLILTFFSQSCDETQKIKNPLDIGSLPRQLSLELPNLAADALPLKFILVDSGTFEMGSPLDELGRSPNDWPPHSVTISTPFYMGQYEVTQAQWTALMDKNPSHFKGGANQPVEKVTWRRCCQFIKRLNQLGQGTFRLPTEAEWEYACRAGTRTRFFFGDAEECRGDANCPQADIYMWWAGDNEPDGPKTVGQKEPNGWGLYDMHGNVHEWCSDRWQAPCERGQQIDPQGPTRGSRFMLFFTNRTVRGGCFRHGGLDHCRSAYRFKEQASDYYYGLGFRLVREVDGKEKSGA